jgi:maltose/moltooligosaccharide transporter
LIADSLPEEQYGKGFLTQSFFTGLGITLANLSLFFFQIYFKGSWGALPVWVYASFFLGTVCSITSVLWSMSKTPEYPPSEEELAALRLRNQGMPHPAIQFFLSILSTLLAYAAFLILLPFTLIDRGLIRKVLSWVDSKPALRVLFAQNLEIVEAILVMPSVMWKLALVYLFQWYALFCYWQNSAKSIALSVWKATPSSDPAAYEEAVGWAGLVNGWYNIVTFLSAFFLVTLAQKYGAKRVHFTCLLLAGIGLLIFPMLENKYALFIPMTGFGIAWASMMGIPYLLVVNEIPKERYGVYMGIINMMIVIPMIFQTLTFGYISKNFLNNDAGQAILFGGVLLLIAALATLRIKGSKTTASPSQVPSGH